MIISQNVSGLLDCYSVFLDRHFPVFWRIIQGFPSPEDEDTMILQNVVTHPTTECHIPEDSTLDAKNYPAAKTIHCSTEQTCFTVSMKFLYLAAVMCYRDSVVCDPATTAFADRRGILQHTSCCDKCVNKYLSTVCGQHVRYDLAACLTRHLQHHWAAIEQEVDQAWWWATWNKCH